MIAGCSCVYFFQQEINANKEDSSVTCYAESEEQTESERNRQ